MYFAQFKKKKRQSGRDVSHGKHSHELSSQPFTPCLVFSPRLPPLCPVFVHLPCSSIFIFLLPLSLFPRGHLSSPLSSLIDFPLNINRKKKKKKQVRKEQHPLAVWLADILDLSLLFVFLSTRACQMTSRLEC